jgi:hypothetical protein
VQRERHRERSEAPRRPDLGNEACGYLVRIKRLLRVSRSV